MSGGKSREQRYASYDEETDTLIYTSYEKDGSVNRYADNKDGGHSHSHWDSKDDYNNGNKPDQHRSESNKSKNPSTGEVQDNGGCYLTSACMRHFQDEFDDNCYELTILRWFRDNFVSKEDKKVYYDVAPTIVKNIDALDDNGQIYDYIYEKVVDACVKAIEKGDYEFAYKRYKSSVLALNEQFGEKEISFVKRKGTPYSRPLFA